MSTTDQINEIFRGAPGLVDRAEDGRLVAADLKGEPVRRLRALLEPLHGADIADHIERLPFGQRLLLWAALPKGRRGEVLIEVGESVLEMLTAEIAETDLANALKGLDVPDIAYILRRVPDDARARMMRLAGLAEDPDLRASLSFGEDTVGEIMDFDPVVFPEGHTVRKTIHDLRRMGELPSHCDKLFVTDGRGRLTGVLPLKRILVNPKSRALGEIMVRAHVYSFRATDSIEYVASAFEKYDLVSAPVLNAHHQVMGRVTSDEILGYLGEQRQRDLMISTGMREEEDFFAPVGRRFRNRWLWLVLNMAAALAVSRMVGLFEGTIERLVALAALMPIIASLSGNAGIQTSTLMVRAIALGHVNRGNIAAMIAKELALSLVSGVVGGLMAALFGYLFYQSVFLSAILFASMVGAFMIAAMAGFFIPLLMERLGKDPALGTAVVLTVITDCVSFFLFLGLGAVFLV